MLVNCNSIRATETGLGNGLKIVTIYTVSIIDSDIVMLKVSLYNIAEIQIFEKLAAKRAKTEKKRLTRLTI